MPTPPLRPAGFFMSAGGISKTTYNPQKSIGIYALALVADLTQQDTLKMSRKNTRVH
jgi:hypothetical protein